jgi:hypothetical protein
LSTAKKCLRPQDSSCSRLYMVNHCQEGSVLQSWQYHRDITPYLTYHLGLQTESHNPSPAFHCLPGWHSSNILDPIAAFGIASPSSSGTRLVYLLPRNRYQSPLGVPFVTSPRLEKNVTWLGTGSSTIRRESWRVLQPVSHALSQPEQST